MEDNQTSNQMNFLRPHHALCALFFEGKGYSQAFIENMTAFLAEPNQMVEITMGCDSLCQECPHNQDGICDDETKVAHFDQGVLHLNSEVFKAKQVFPLSGLCQNVCNTILQQDLLAEVCGDCEWAALCQGKWQRGEINHFLLQSEHPGNQPA